MRLLLVGALAGLIAGCGPRGLPDAPGGAPTEMFAPAAMRIHPIFSQARGWSGGGGLDGFEALIEFRDLYGDPTKAAGTFLFELYEYRPGRPDPRGRRLATWAASILSIDEQSQRWNRTSRTYGFRLAYPEIRFGRAYVLSATFQAAGAGRFIDQIVLETPAEERRDRSAEPSTRPFAP